MGMRLVVPQILIIIAPLWQNLSHLINPASEHSLKAMLLSLQSDMQKELRSSINHLHDRMDGLEDRTDNIEQHLSAAAAGQ